MSGEELEQESMDDITTSIAKVGCGWSTWLHGAVQENLRASHAGLYREVVAL